MINRLTAPGKLMICGEYVVLDGVEAMVTAVDARAAALIVRSSARPASGVGPGLPPEAVLARKFAEQDLGPADMDLRIDVGALQHAGRKLGLGSSAAVAVLGAAAVLAWHGGDPGRERRRILHWALSGHQAIAPQGSGADVAASALGGLVRFRRDAVEEARVIRWPAALEVVVVWTGQPARTSDFVSAVRTLATDHPARYRKAAARLREVAGAMGRAIVEEDVGEVVHLAAQHGEAMAVLGDAAGVPIVTASLRQVFELAKTYRGGAKPSGAGGGDVALAFFSEPTGAALFRSRCESVGLTPLPLALGAEGVRAEEAPPIESQPKERG